MVRVELICLATLDVHVSVLREAKVADVARQRLVITQVEAE
jgi:hypothetical protein